MAPLNLELPPFNFPKPLALITEEIKYNNAVYVTKSLALWELKDIPCANVPTFDDAMKCHTRDALVYNKLNQQSHLLKQFLPTLKTNMKTIFASIKTIKSHQEFPRLFTKFGLGQNHFLKNVKNGKRAGWRLTLTGNINSGLMMI